MASPFPGMDPFLEGYLWPDLHNALAAKIRQVLTPLIRPRYAARLNVYVVEDGLPESELGIMYPDVELIRQSDAGQARSSSPGAAAATPAALSIPVLLPVDVQIPVVEIRDTARNQLVTAIEILSPVNKREPGLSSYRQKRRRLYQAGVHLLELDLLRRGQRPLMHPDLPQIAYLIMLTRAQSGQTVLWPLSLRDSWPNVPIPLHPPDTDVVLPLGSVFQAVYDEAAYDLSIDYQQSPPPPALSPADQQWMRELLAQA